ncbi:MAG: neutral/alkaline non-lysosomal ceramidase N-terminal domain-containing protein [Kofleriaceae bacterium]
MRRPASAFASALLTLAACGGGDDAPPVPDAPPTPMVSTDHCDYVDVAPTAGAGGTVSAGTLTAGAAEAILEVPVGTALGGYTARAGFGGDAGTVDDRRVKLTGAFNASVGVTNAPRVKAVALTAGDETVVILKLDVVFVYEGLLFDLEERLGAAYHGKVIIASSHSHSGWAQFTGHAALKLGAGELRDVVYQRFLDQLESTAQAALAARRPAKLGVHVDTTFDPDDVITRDRRDDNDDLMGGSRKDDQLVMIRIDGVDDAPIAIVPIYGVHGTLNSEDNPMASSDAPGAVERTLEEQFDDEVVVMHLNSAGGDVSPVGHGGVDCDLQPGRATDPCLEWTKEEGHGRAAMPTLYAAWQAAGAGMQTSLPLEMLTRSIELGPYPETFSIRDGALTYAPFDAVTEPDGVIVDGSGALVSPIDEFNAPVGAALCEDGEPLFPGAAIPATEGLTPYGSCLRLDVAGEIMGPIFDIDFGITPTAPLCESTRTTITALRLGEYVLETMPGEVTVMIKDQVRAQSPVAADKTIVVGYAQGHVGYLLTPEDWVRGGYEPSITFWGPLEAEHIVEQAATLMPLATTDTREDGAAGGLARVATRIADDGLQIDDPAPMAGTVPATVPAETWVRSGTPATAQPATTVPRVAGLATFVWYGDDPLVKTPSVRLEVESAPGVWAPVVRRSGRQVIDQELVLSYTPQPLRRVGTDPLTHVWALEWQAVPWQGAVDVDGLDARGGVPLGNYRFHVEGDGWTLDSDAFAVVPGGLEAQVTATTTTTATVTIRWSAPKGWRTLDLSLPSNRPVPVRSQPVTVRMLSGVAVVGTATGATDAQGSIVADGGVPLAAVTSLEVEDRFGNVTTVPLAAVAAAAPRAARTRPSARR